MTFVLDALNWIPNHKRYWRGIRQEDQAAGGNCYFKVPTEARHLDLNIYEEVVGTSTTCTADSGMEHILNKMIMKLAMILMIYKFFIIVNKYLVFDRPSG